MHNCAKHHAAISSFSWKFQLAVAHAPSHYAKKKFPHISHRKWWWQPQSCLSVVFIQGILEPGQGLSEGFHYMLGTTIVIWVLLQTLYDLGHLAIVIWQELLWNKYLKYKSLGQVFKKSDDTNLDGTNVKDRFLNFGRFKLNSGTHQIFGRHMTCNQTLKSHYPNLYNIV